VRLSLVDALAADGQHAAALTEARWLATHRGRAYSETINDMMLVPTNVVHSRLAWIYQAEQAIRQARPDIAAAALQRFGQAWGSAVLPLPIAERFNAAHEALAALSANASAGS